jgi:UDP-N-acetylenolpyruvoylglucosamine reductase
LGLTVNELNALAAHKKKEDARQDRLAAFAGYSAAAGVAKWFAEGLPPFREFYGVPGPRPQKPSLYDHIQMMKDVGEGGPP